MCCRSLYQNACTLCGYYLRINCIYFSVRLNLGYNASMGAVEVYQDNKWFTICDETFDNDDATVVCRTLNFTYGKAIHGSAFGNVSGPIGFTNINCKGDEVNFFDCHVKLDKRCERKTYASVYCSQTLVNTGIINVVCRKRSGQVKI